ncbi:MAG: DUF4956 domain-containing protein [Actinobacteria bacterium]|nr:DUF4956 domain-containing protein [Actinomycetota bacterium]
MPRSALFALDIAAIIVLAFGLYFPRHRRKDMLVAYMGVNVGVLAVAYSLASASVGAGLGLGLFGVLSIIRLRSTELDQPEVAYYFASLAIGLLSAFEVSPSWVSPALIVTILVSLFVADHPRVFGRHRVQVLTLDRAFTSEKMLIDHLQTLLDGHVHRVIVRRVDLVRDTTVVEARYRMNEPPDMKNTAEVSEVAATR